MRGATWGWVTIATVSQALESRFHFLARHHGQHPYNNFNVSYLFVLETGSHASSTWSVTCYAGKTSLELRDHRRLLPNLSGRVKGVNHHAVLLSYLCCFTSSASCGPPPIVQLQEKPQQRKKKLLQVINSSPECWVCLDKYTLVTPSLSLLHNALTTSKPSKVPHPIKGFLYHILIYQHKSIPLDSRGKKIIRYSTIIR